MPNRFDLTDLFAWPDNVWMKPLPAYPVVPHAYSFVYHQIMGDEPPPHVPVIMNCFYPPTQPSIERWRTATAPSTAGIRRR